MIQVLGWLRHHLSDKADEMASCPSLRWAGVQLSASDQTSDRGSCKLAAELEAATRTVDARKLLQ